MQDKKQRGGNRNPTGKGGFKERPEARNTAGQRNATAVAFNRTLREIIAGVGNEELSKDGRSYSRIELAVRGLYQKAAKGDVSAFNALVERVEGKVPQQNQVTGADGKDIVVRLIEQTINSHADD